MRDRLDLNAIDLNLLPKFRALYRHRNVSEASRELHLTQSALSNALARMRSLFADELFVRTATGMEPTPFAHAIALPIDRALAKLEGEFSHVNGFEPMRSSRTFRIATTQIGEAWLAPRIVALARTSAPDVVVNTVPVDDRHLGSSLQGGAIDFAIGHFPDLGAGFRESPLGVHEVVCLLRDGHPILDEPLTLSALVNCTFAEVVEPGSVYGTLSRALMRNAPSDAMRFRTGNVLALPHVIAETDLVAIVPAWFGARCARDLGLRVIRLPNESSFVTIHLFWHENLEADPGHAWMRSVIKQAADSIDTRVQYPTVKRLRECAGFSSSSTSATA